MSDTDGKAELLWPEKEIESLRQRVKELEESLSIAINTGMDQITTLKQSQGEPVYYEITLSDGTRFVAANRSILEGTKSKPLCYCAAAPKPEDVK